MTIPLCRPVHRCFATGREDAEQYARQYCHGTGMARAVNARISGEARIPIQDEEQIKYDRDGGEQWWQQRKRQVRSVSAGRAHRCGQ
jgi:hypothetical protein